MGTTRRQVRLAVNSMRSGPEGEEKGKRVLQSLSIQGLENGFWDADFGANPGGIYSALSPDPMHQLETGLMPYWHTAVMAKIREFGGDDAVALLDERAREIGAATLHQSERAVPRKSFPHGISDLPKLNAQEMPAVLVVAIFAIGDNGAILPKKIAQPWQSVAWELLVMRAYLLSETWSDQMRLIFKKHVRLVMMHFREIVGPVRATKKNPTGVNFIKFHLSKHYSWFEEEYGPMILAYAAWWEKSHQVFAKTPVKRTQRRSANLLEQVRTTPRALFLTSVVGHWAGAVCIIISVRLPQLKTALGQVLPAAGHPNPLPHVWKRRFLSFFLQTERYGVHLLASIFPFYLLL
jgi:hypothetical protein